MVRDSTEWELTWIQLTGDGHALRIASWSATSRPQARELAKPAQKSLNIWRCRRLSILGIKLLIYKSYFVSKSPEGQVEEQAKLLEFRERFLVGLR
jgi:hypothetical protein